MARRRRRQFSPEFKAEAVRLVHTTEAPIASIAQQLGGAMAERLATTAADAFYASYRMGRLGVIVMDMCRPIPFQDDEVPKISAMVMNVIRQRGET